jgi:hypothetical protein
VIVFFWFLFSFWQGENFSLILVLSISIGLPIATYYFFRKSSTDEITVILFHTKMEIQWPSRKMEILFNDVKSYSACRTSQESYDRESVRIRLKNGKNIRLTATSDIVDLGPLANFRKSFDMLAQSLKLEHKSTWEERILMKE